MEREGERERTVSGWKARMRGSDEKCVTGRIKGGGKRAREGKRGRDAERGRDGERGRRKGKEGVAERVTEKDCATDGDMESQGRREQEWGVWEGLGEGPRGQRAGAG